MRLAKLRKIDILALVLFIGLFWFFYSVSMGGFIAATETRTNKCVSKIIDFLSKHSGSLPTQEQLNEMCNGKNGFQFKIQSDFKITDIKSIDNKLVDTESGEEVCILRGPVNWIVSGEQREIYKEASLKIYNAMKKVSDTNTIELE